jgi:hypothetical protein
MTKGEFGRANSERRRPARAHWLAWFLLLIAGFGLFISSPAVLAFVAGGPVWIAAVLLYGVLFAFAAAAGFIHSGEFNARHSAAVLLLFWAFAILAGYANSPLTFPITGAKVTPAETGLEETLTYYFWIHLTSDPLALRLLVYVLTPVLAIAGAAALLSDHSRRRGEVDIKEEIRRAFLVIPFFTLQNVAIFLVGVLLWTVFRLSVLRASRSAPGLFVLSVLAVLGVAFVALDELDLGIAFLALFALAGVVILADRRKRRVSASETSSHEKV